MKKLMLSLAVLASMSVTVAAQAGRLVATPAGCSNAGDEVARPVYKRVGGRLVLVGYECQQDNRGGNGG